MTETPNTNLPRNDWLARLPQAVFDCRTPADAESALYARRGVWTRLAEPEIQLRLGPLWMDDAGAVRSSRVFCAGSLSAGPDIHIFLRPGFTADRARALAFVLSLSRRLHGRPGGVWICGADVDPDRLTDGESMRFCRSLRDALHRIAPGFRITEADAPDRERGYLGTVDRPPFSTAQAVGYGAVCFAAEYLRRGSRGRWDGKTIALADDGPAARYAAQAARRMGARPVAFDAPADIVFPGGARILDTGGAAAVIARKPALVAELSPLACTPDAAAMLSRAGIPLVPYIAIGGTADLSAHADSVWELERRIRRRTERLLDRLSSDAPEHLCRDTYAAALHKAAEALVRRGL